MIRYLITSWLSWTVAVGLILFVGWHWPEALTPWINFNTAWAQWALQGLIAHAPYPLDKLAWWIMWILEKAGTLAVWLLKKAEPAHRQHIELIGRMYLTAGGMLLIGQLSIAFMVLWRLLSRFREWRKLCKWRRNERKEPTFS